MLRKSRKDKVVDQATSTTTQVKDVVVDKVVPAVSHAAESTRDWAGPKVHAAKEWAAPRAQKGIDAAAPRVEHAVDAVSPRIDAARDKLVDEVLPKLVDAITAATSQAAAVREEASSRGSDAVAVLKGDAVAKPKKRHRVRKVLLLGGLVAGGAAAFKAMRGKKEDPWATPAGTTSWAPATPAPSSTPAAAAEAEADLQDAAASEATGSSDSGSGEGSGGGGSEGSSATAKTASPRPRKTAAKKADGES